MSELDQNGEPRIIKLMINRLVDQDDYPDLRKNIKVALENVAELPAGFLKICHELSDKVEILDEIFGARSIKALHELLPKLNEYGEGAPEIRGSNLEDRIQDYSQYLKAMALIFGKYKEEAAKVAQNQTINFSEKIAPFLNPSLNLQQEVLICLNETKIDIYNCHIMFKFLKKYGKIDLVTAKVAGGGVLVTTIEDEFEREDP